MNQPSIRMRLIGIAAVIAVALGTGIVAAEGPDDPLARGFQTPPASAKPRVWWHWMSGNITKEGIKADLEWMKRTGIAGFQNFDAGLETPQIVDKRLVYMTPGWKDAFKYTATLADELGLEMAIAGSPGWSESGGPWVTPAQAMKKYVWSETRLEGGRPFSGVLPKPPSTTGPYQNLGGRHEGFGEGSKAAPPEFYADSAVVAFRVPENDRTPAELGAKVTSSGGAFDLAALTDGDLAEAVLLPAAPVDGKSWIQFAYDRPQAVRGLTLIAARGERRGDYDLPELEASDDGRDFRSVLKLPGDAVTVAFAPVTAKFFRVSIRTRPRSPGQALPAAPDKPAGIPVAELVLHAVSPVNRFQDKAAFDIATDIYSLATPAVPDGDAVAKADVVDLTSKMRAERQARLDPAGRPLDRPPLRLLAHRRPQLPGLAGGHRARGRQARPGPRQGLFRQLPRPVQERHRRPHGQARSAVRDHRQLGSRGRQLDRRDDRRSSRSAAATTCAPGCRSWPAGSSKAPRRATGSSGISARPWAT